MRIEDIQIDIRIDVFVIDLLYRSPLPVLITEDVLDMVCLIAFRKAQTEKVLAAEL